jgi:Holliday junction resolvasome RuvABC endonuclease subunit
MNKSKWGVPVMPDTICAIDASTNSLAFALFTTDTNNKFGKSLGTIGKINFEGKDTYEKVMDAGKKVKAFFDYYGGFEAIIIEHTVFMNSPKTAADLALVQGAILGAAGQSGTEVIGKVSPITWQNFIGNKKISKEEQLLIRSSNPGKSVSWYKSYERNLRKERTIKFINTIYDRTITDNDVADACGIGHWALSNWTKAIGVDK